MARVVARARRSEKITAILRERVYNVHEIRERIDDSSFFNVWTEISNS
jgi:hypothetical protein